MKLFLKKVLAFIGLFLLLWGIILGIDFGIIKNQYLYNYQASILDKLARAASIEGKKILLLGNSNVSFGFDSALLEKLTGYPVVNLGIHSGLSNMFQEDMAKKYISEGDIVLLCHNSFNDGYKISDPSLAWITIEKHTDLWPIIRDQNKKEMVQAYPLYAFDCLLLGVTGRGNRIEDSCYSRESFNEYGDIVYKPDFESRAASTMFYEGAIRVPKISDETIDRVNEFNDFCLEKGATLLVIGYPIADGEFTPPREEFVEFQNELSDRLHCPVISDYTDYFIPYEYFYNTVLHLTEEGAVIRTKQTAADVNNYLGAE